MRGKKNREQTLIKEIRQKMGEFETIESYCYLEDLKATNRFLNHILESSSSISIIATDKNRIIRYWNAGAENMFGYRSAEVVDRTKIDILYPLENRETKKTIDAARTGALDKNKGSTTLKISSKRAGMFSASLYVGTMIDSDGDSMSVIF